eukprot:1144222-Pelagomonas_calceolata.AAC.1
MNVPLFWKELTRVTDFGSRWRQWLGSTFPNEYWYRCIRATKIEPLFVRETMREKNQAPSVKNLYALIGSQAGSQKTPKNIANFPPAHY